MALRASPQLSSTGGRSLAEYATPRLPKKRGCVWGVCVPQVRNTHLSRPHCTRHPMQILREHIMVRVGGGWDTLEHYLDKHDPCRCTSLCESPRPQTLWLCPVAGVRGGGVGWSIVGLAASGAVCRSGRLRYHDASVALLENVWFWGLSSALVATRGHGRLLDGAGPQKYPLRGAQVCTSILRELDAERRLGGLQPGVGAMDRGAEPLPIFPAAHKQAWKTRSPQQQVQHEICLCPASKAATRGQSQPLLLVSRSQSPLPPVAWGSRAPPGSRPPTSPSPEGSGCLPGASPRREPAQPRRVPSGR